MYTFDTSQPISATIEVAGARVRVTASNRTDTVVLVEPINEASRKDVKVVENTEVKLTDGQLLIKMTKAGNKKGSVAITIELPAGSSLAAYMWSSTVQVDGQLGSCELYMASGQVQLDRVDAFQASLSTGEVTVGRIAGPVSIQGATFKLRIGEVNGPVGLQNSGGRVWIGHASAALNLSSGTCDFDIDRADGDVIATTGGGGVRIGRMTNGRAKLTNGSGDLVVGISDDTAASVDVNSERGAVHNLLPKQEEAHPSDPRVSVFARTRHGDITIQRAAS